MFRFSLFLAAYFSCAWPCHAQDPVPGAVSEKTLAKCDRYLAELFRQPDEMALVDELCQRIELAHNTEDLSVVKKLPPAQKLLWDVWSSKAVIDNGGMEHFLTAGFIDYSGRAQSFRDLGLNECADLLEKSYDDFPGAKIPGVIEERRKVIERMPVETSDRWDDFSDEYFRKSGRLTLLLGEYARNNAEAFVSLHREISDDQYAALLRKDVSPPSPDATVLEVVRWLETIGGGSLDSSHEVLGHVWLGKDRRSTSEELKNLAAMDARRDIEEIGLDDTSFCDEDAPLLLKFPRLRSLSLDNVDASERTVDVIEQISALRVLAIRHTKIPYERFRKLVQQKQFETISYAE